jgi:hypothetical protein
MFYVGQKVVALVTYRDYGLIEGQVYTVSHIVTCECGYQHISWGVYHDMNDAIEGCSICVKEWSAKSPCWIVGSKRFAPLESYRESYSIAIQLVQEMEQVDKQKVFNPKKETIKN